MIDLSKCKKGDILICKHGVIKEYVSPIVNGHSDHNVRTIYVPEDSDNPFIIMEGTMWNDGFVFRKTRMEGDWDVLRVVDREVFKRYLRMLSYKL